MTATTTEFAVPAIVRGSLIADGLIRFDGRNGTASFEAPDPQRLLAELPLRDPDRLHDVQELPFEEIADYLEALGDALVLERNPYLQEALELSAEFSDMTE